MDLILTMFLPSTKSNRLSTKEVCKCLDSLGGRGEREKMETWDLNLSSLVFKQPKD